MEQRYFEPEAERYFSGKIDFESYFNEYGRLVANALLAPSIKVEDTKLMEECTKKLFPPKTDSKDGDDLPFLDGFKCAVDDIPDSVKNLKSLMILRRRTKKNIQELRKKMSYPGQVDLEDTLLEGSFENIVDLAPCAFYILTVRVYIPVAHSKYTMTVRARELQVSQEFLCLSSTGLDTLRDRIACANDFQPADGDISYNPSMRTQIRTGDLHQSAMFYIGNDFYIDGRRPDNVDYSFPLIEWGKREGFEFGRVLKMEQTTLADAKSVRLGYPYVYMHQGTCEHIVIISDARLLHPGDCLDSTKYPMMIAFSSLSPRHCFACHVKIAKYVVVDGNRLPEDAVFMCTTCLESFNYKKGNKIGQFKLYSYVDRAALL